MPVSRLSIEVNNRCQKNCSFCYNGSHPHGTTKWTPSDIVSFVVDCQNQGAEAVSLGGGEPLLFEGIFEIIQSLEGVLFRSLTTNGLLLSKPEIYKSLLASQPDKVHISIHDVEDKKEVERVIDQVKRLDLDGIRSGINLLVRLSKISDAKIVSKKIEREGIGKDRVINIPFHGNDSPTPEQIAFVAGEQPFQSVSCLKGCRISHRFCSISWDKEVGWCSYTSSRKKLNDLSAAGLSSALKGLALEYCGSNLPRL